MSNDRLYLVCKECGEETALFKYYPGDLYPVHDVEGRLTMFGLDHRHDAYGMNLGDKAPFALETERATVEYRWKNGRRSRVKAERKSPVAPGVLSPAAGSTP